MRLRALPLTIAVVVSAVAASPAARADDKMACVKAYEDAQTLKKAGKLRASRVELTKCASDACPQALRNDCKPWLKEVDDVLASIVLAVHTKDGRDLVDVHVTADGEPFAEKIDGWAQPIEPGVHVLRFEARGFRPAEERVVVHEGEKRRSVEVALASLQAEPVSKPPAPEPPPPPPPPEPARPIPVASIALAGVGVVGVGAFSYFALTGVSQKSDLDRCKPTCPQSQVDEAKQSFLIGDIALGVGVVSLAAAAYLYFSRGELTTSQTTGARVEVAPARGGATFGVAGSF